jgi:proteasome alpha subunit
MSESQNGNRFPFYGPQGRLILVDSALEAVSRGSTTIGIKTPNFAMIASQIKPTHPLMEPSEKIFPIDFHIGATGAGYIGDILQLIDTLRLESQKHRLTYETPIDIDSLAKHLSSFLHNYTTYAVRPQAASMIVVGEDQTGIQLYQVDPSGTFFRGSGFAIGQASETALDTITKGYNKNLSLDQAIELGRKAIEKALGEKPIVETGIIEPGKAFRKIRTEN